MNTLNRFSCIRVASRMEKCHHALQRIQEKLEKIGKHKPKSWIKKLRRTIFSDRICRICVSFPVWFVFCVHVLEPITFYSFPSVSGQIEFRMRWSFCSQSIFNMQVTRTDFALRWLLFTHFPNRTSNGIQRVMGEKLRLSSTWAH